MRVAIRRLSPNGRRNARLNPHLWERFKRAAREYMDTSDREVNVGWEWYYNGATRRGASPSEEVKRD
jgi:hypothetical protein